MLDSYRILNENKFLYSIRNGMVLAIPAYQRFVESFGNGFLVTVFTVAQKCTGDIFVLILLERFMTDAHLPEYPAWRLRPEYVPNHRASDRSRTNRSSVCFHPP